MAQGAYYPEDILQEEADLFRQATAGLSGEDLAQKSAAHRRAREPILGAAQAAITSDVAGAEAFYTKHAKGLAPTQEVGRGAKAFAPVGGYGVAGKAALAVAGVLGAAGVLASISGAGQTRDPPPSLRRVNYQGWLDQQDKLFGTRGSGSYDRGMGHGGVAGAKRKTNTDFGSPYQGPIAASHVFMEQDLLAEREKFLRQRFGNIHGISGFYPTVGRTKHTFIGAGTNAQGYMLPGITGGSASTQVLDLADWKVSASDADTITVKKGGIRGAVQSFFGMNRGYDFRLAGIDAPETFHGELGMKTAQPHADDATNALRAMLGETGDLQLVFDPENVTYGRMVGAVIADGRNVNFELAKRGHVAALPFFKKGTTPLVDTGAIQRLESFSRRGQTGMWEDPFFQIYSDVADVTGKRMTFNTFSRMSKVARNATTMSMSSLMQNAQDQGFVSTADRIAATQIGTRFKEAGFSEDYRSMMVTDYKNTPHNSYMHEMMMDSASLMKTRGGITPYKTSRRSGYGELDKTMAIDSLGTTNSIWNKRKLSSYEVYGVDNQRRQRRREDMAFSQRHALRDMFVSPINHHRM